MTRNIGRLVAFNQLTHALKRGFVGNAQMIERLGGQALFFLQQGQKHVLGAHIRLVQGTRLFLGKHQNLPGLVGKLVEGHVILDSPGKYFNSESC